MRGTCGIGSVLSVQELCLTSTRPPRSNKRSTSLRLAPRRRARAARPWGTAR